MSAAVAITSVIASAPACIGRPTSAPNGGEAQLTARLVVAPSGFCTRVPVRFDAETPRRVLAVVR